MLAVEEVIQTFDYANEEHCPESVADVYRLLRSVGLDSLTGYLGSLDFVEFTERSPVEADQFVRLQNWALDVHLGDWIFRQLPKQYTESPLPYYFFQVGPKGRGFVLSFKFLPRTDLEYQRIWHSACDPTVEIRGRDYRVGFTKHVFERACQRMSLTQPVDYIGMRAINGHFQSCVYYEHVLLENGQDALRLFGPCVYEIGDIYMRDVAQLKQADMTTGEWFFLIGYCPVELADEGFAIGLTLLFPGYKNTPEAALVKRTRMHPKLFAELQAASFDNSLGAVYMTKNLKPLRWYHYNGVPQVVRLEKPLYR